MVLAGLAVEALFSAGGMIPSNRSQTAVPTHFEWNYTTFLNFAFIAIGGYLYWLYRNRDRLGGGLGYAFDPVCGMQVQTRNAPVTRTHDGHEHWFCSDHCARDFDGHPGEFCSVAPTEESV